MASRTRSRLWVSGACYVGLAAFATLASGLTVVARGPFALAPNSNLDIYTAPSTPEPLAAVTVATQTGSTVQVRGYRQGSYTALAPVPPKRTCVFEGPFTRVNLAAPASPPPIAAAGTYEVRAPTNGPDADRLLGFGVLDLLPGSSYGVYGSYDGTCALVARPRLLAVNLTGNGSSASVTTSGGTPSPTPPYVIDGGDWGFCSRTISTFRIAGTGLVPFEVYDPTPNCLPIQGIASAQSVGDQDSIDLDGLRDLEITLAYHGAGPLSLSYATAGNATVIASIPSGGSSGPIQGLLSKFEWTYAQPGDWVSISIRGN